MNDPSENSPSPRAPTQGVPNKQWITLADAAQQLGTTLQGVRSRIKRGSLEKTMWNDGRLRVRLPLDTAGRALGRPPMAPQGEDGAPAPLGAQGGRDQAIALLAEQHAAELVRLEARYAAELTRAYADIDYERKRGADLSDQVKALAVRLDRLHHDRHADIERHRQEIAALQTELQQASRPWWQRWRK
jgi:hypothetical protein